MIHSFLVLQASGTNIGWASTRHAHRPSHPCFFFRATVAPAGHHHFFLPPPLFSIQQHRWEPGYYSAKGFPPQLAFKGDHPEGGGGFPGLGPGPGSGGRGLGLGPDLAEMRSFVSGLKRRIGSEIGMLLEVEKDLEDAGDGEGGEGNPAGSSPRHAGLPRVMGGFFTRGEAAKLRKFIPLPLMGAHRSRRRRGP